MSNANDEEGSDTPNSSDTSTTLSTSLTVEEVNEEANFHSTIHDTTIDLKDFKSWLNDCCTTLEMIKDDYHVKTKIGYDNVKLISNGLDIWKENNDDVTRLQNLYKRSYAAAPTSTQFVESMIKNANFCDKANRSESMKSTLASTRQSVQNKSNLLAQKLSDEDKKRRTGTGYSTNHKFKPRGKQKLIALAKTVSKTHKQILNVTKDDPNAVKAKKEKVVKSFKAVRSQRDIDDLNQPNRRKKKTENAITKQSGVHHTALMRREVQLGLIANGPVTISVFKRELRMRGVAFGEEEGFMELRKKLYADEKAKRKNQTDYNDKFIKPMLPFDVWDGLPTKK